MKKEYIKPHSLEISLLPRDGMLLTGSNEGYEITPPFDSGISSSVFNDTEGIDLLY